MTPRPLIGFALVFAACTPSLNGLGDLPSDADDGALDDRGTRGDDGSEDDGSADTSNDVALDANDGEAPTYVRDGLYPRSTSLKGVAPNGGDLTALTAAKPGRVLVGLPWSAWEPARKAPPCAATEVESDGHCFVVPSTTDALVKTMTDAKVVVAGVLWSTPAWASTATRSAGCRSGSDCAPDDAADFARFASLIATRYGDHVTAADDHGRVSDFFVGRAVNTRSHFDVGTPPTGTDLRTHWTTTYQTLFLAAYDAIVAQTGDVHVLPFLDSYTGPDATAAADPQLSPWTLLDALATTGGSRTWHTGIQPSGGDPNFSPADPAYVLTMGNVGTFAGALQAHYPGSPHALLDLVNVGFDANPSRFDTISGTSGPAAQANATCRSVRQAVATPGIEAWTYYELVDAPSESAAGLYFGLRDVADAPRAAWSVFATMDASGTLDCGFENLPNVTLFRRANGAKHWMSTRMASAGYVLDGTIPSFLLQHDGAAGTQELFECFDASHGKRFVSLDPKCEGTTPMGALGYAWTASGAGRFELLRCDSADGGDSLVTTNASCEGFTFVTSLGWVSPAS